MSDYVEMDGNLIYWPMCPINNCENRVCLALQSEYCHPHTFTQGMSSLPEIQLNVEEASGE